MAAAPLALVVGAHVNGLGSVRALGRESAPVEVVRTLRSDVAHRSRYARAHHDLLELGVRPNVLGEFLERRVERWRGAVVLPTNDHALIDLARNHDRLSRDFRLACPPWELVERVVDKRITAAHARAVGVSTPEVFGKATSAFSGARELPYPVLVKPTQGHDFNKRFNRKLFMVRDAEELLDVARRVEEAGFDCDVVEYVVGPDTATQHFQAYMDAEGRVHGAFTFRKLRQQPPRFGVARACEAEDAPEIHELGLALLEHVGWRGVASVAFKTDARTGRRHLMEINGRMPLSQGLAWRTGRNYPYMAYSEAAWGEVRGDRPNGWSGVWIHLHSDVFATVKNLGREEWSWREFLASYRGPKTFADWARDDPAPFLHQWRLSLGTAPRALGRLARRAVAKLKGVASGAGGPLGPRRRPGRVRM